MLRCASEVSPGRMRKVECGMQNLAAARYGCAKAFMTALRSRRGDSWPRGSVVQMSAPRAAPGAFTLYLRCFYGAGPVWVRCGPDVGMRIPFVCRPSVAGQVGVRPVWLGWPPGLAVAPLGRQSKEDRVGTARAVAPGMAGDQGGTRLGAMPCPLAWSNEIALGQAREPTPKAAGPITRSGFPATPVSCCRCNGPRPRLPRQGWASATRWSGRGQS